MLDRGMPQAAPILAAGTACVRRERNSRTSSILAADPVPVSSVDAGIVLMSESSMTAGSRHDKEKAYSMLDCRAGRLQR